MTLAERAFGAAVAASRPLLPLLGLASRELGRAAAERRGAVSRLRAWAERERDPHRPLLWLHGASAGELTGAAAVVSELRRRGDLQLLVTYFSPSAEAVLDRLRPDVAEVLPLDTGGDTRRALRAVRPDALVFAKGDVWPNLTRSAEGRGVAMGLVNGTVRPGSSRLRWPARRLLRSAHARLARAGAASVEDARRLVRLGVREEALTVTGDASAAWALERVRRASSDPRSPARLLERRAAGPGPLLVAGSTWREDEAAILEAAARMRASGHPLRLCLVPHDPTPEAMDAIRRLCREALGVMPRLWSEGDAAGRTAAGDGGSEPGDGPRAGEEAPRPVLVDAVGVLAELYAAADLAYVGGGLGGSGLHSVVEPAAAGVPVLFGARSDRREARALARAGGGRRVGDAGELAAALTDLAADDETRRRAGRAARSVAEGEAGAAAAGADLVEALLEGTGGRR